ncbi:MAG: hypothetical protein OER88_10455, partial [Planctomycetota bacterium]|nr:hypothetical protein [Planctomycetota bacterium]
PDPAWIRAAALARLGDFDEARSILERLPPDQHGHPRSCIIRAELAFRQRDFAAAREEAERMGAADRPRWLTALVETKL